MKKIIDGKEYVVHTLPYSRHQIIYPERLTGKHVRRLENAAAQISDFNDMDLIYLFAHDALTETGEKIEIDRTYVDDMDAVDITYGLKVTAELVAKIKASNSVKKK